MTSMRERLLVVITVFCCRHEWLGSPHGEPRCCHEGTGKEIEVFSPGEFDQSPTFSAT